jgi:hypothetical protein
LLVLILLRYPFLPLQSFSVSDLVSASRGNLGSTAISRSFVCLGLSEHTNLFLPAIFLFWGLKDWIGWSLKTNLPLVVFGVLGTVCEV